MVSIYAGDGQWERDPYVRPRSGSDRGAYHCGCLVGMSAFDGNAKSSEPIRSAHRSCSSTARRSLTPQLGVQLLHGLRTCWSRIMLSAVTEFPI
jgi:hypothetical protein